MMTEEKIVTINLRKSLVKSPNCRRSKSAVLNLRKMIEKMTKTSDVKIDKDLNELMWQSGIKRHPTKLRIKLVKSDDKITAHAML